MARAITWWQACGVTIISMPKRLGTSRRQKRWPTNPAGVLAEQEGGGDPGDQEQQRRSPGRGQQHERFEGFAGVRAFHTSRSTAAMPASICAMVPRCPAAGPIATRCAPGSGWPEASRTMIARHPARIAGLCCKRTSRHDRTQPDSPAHRRPPWSARFAEGVSLTTTPRSSVWKKSTASWKTPISGTTPNARRPWAASARCSTRPSTASAI